MPKWVAPGSLIARTDGVVGRIDSVRFESTTTKGSRVLQVYLPARYDQSKDFYPVVYVHGSRRPFSQGLIDISLDNLIGKTVRPMILVVVPSLIGGGYSEYMGQGREAYAQIFVKEVVPLIDRSYRTLKGREGRANMGTIYGGFMAFYATYKYPALFSKLAVQTMAWDQVSQAEDATLIVPASEQRPIEIYLDWGKYDLRSPMEGNDLGKSSASFAQLLRDRGCSFSGGMANDGSGWVSWRNRFDQVFESLFPLID